jgi:nucleoid-associated protein YgaU
MRKTVVLLVTVSLFIGMATVLSAQSLLDNEFYNKAKDLRAQSEQALADGEYDKAADLATQAKEQLAKSDEYVIKMRSFYTANGWLSRAKDRIDYAKSIQADVNFKAQYDKAVASAQGAKEAMDAEKYDESTALSKEAVAALENVRVVQKVAPPPVEEKPTLPAEYTVRLIMSKRDCFWRIAGYPFVYNDPWKWRTLWEANKSVVTDPNNPNLILPGQVFTIPSIAGENREGMYDPEKTYEPLQAQQ